MGEYAHLAGHKLVFCGCTRYSSMQIIPTLGSKVYKSYLHWAFFGSLGISAMIRTNAVQ